MLEDGAGDILWIVRENAGGPALIYSFGEFRLDTGQFRLTSDGVPVHVEPLVFDLLRLFVENCGAVVDRDRMLAEVWDGRFVSEATLSTAVKSARRALGDSGEAQTWIETVRGRGFRFKGAVSVEVPARPAAPPAARARSRPGVPARSAPSIAVLPFVRHRRRRRLPGARGRAAARGDHRARAAALAVRDRARLVVPLPRAGGRHRRGRTDASGCATC